MAIKTLKHLLDFLLGFGLAQNANSFPEVLDKAIYYSFDVPIHLDKEVNGKCYGIEDDGKKKMLITDCGGYLNVISATVTFSLFKSSDKTKLRYVNAAMIYLNEKSQKCQIDETKDLGGRIFEISYECL